MGRAARRAFIATITLLSIHSTRISAIAEPRLALLIGNQTYNEKVGPLKNPFNDVTLLEAALKKLRFEVSVIKDADYRTMRAAIGQQILKVKQAGRGTINFFYYSGHGASNATEQTNYLIPVDVPHADDETLWASSIAQGEITEKFSDLAPNAVHFVIFDACRNELNLTRRGVKAVGTAKGFVPVANAAGMLIAYATAPKQSASDAGAYAKALAEEIVKPGVEAVTMFRTVHLRVQQEIAQDPWLAFPTLSPVYFAGKVTVPPQLKLTVTGVRKSIDKETRVRTEVLHEENKHCEADRSITWSLRAGQGWTIDPASVEVAAKPKISERSTLTGVVKATDHEVELAGVLRNSGECTIVIHRIVPTDKIGLIEIEVSFKENRVVERAAAHVFLEATLEAGKHFTVPSTNDGIVPAEILLSRGEELLVRQAAVGENAFFASEFDAGGKTLNIRMK